MPVDILRRCGQHYSFIIQRSYTLQSLSSLLFATRKPIWARRKGKRATAVPLLKKSTQQVNNMRISYWRLIVSVAALPFARYFLMSSNIVILGHDIDASVPDNVVYFHSCSSSCLPNLRNHVRFKKIRTYSNSRSSKVIDLDALDLLVMCVFYTRPTVAINHTLGS